jgi:hypothetical protein
MEFEFPQKHSHELVLFFYPSPGLNWMTPKALTLTTTRNKLLGLPRGIGHVSIFVRTPKKTVLTGMTQSKKHEGRLEVLWQGFGLGILLHNFSGALEDGERLAPELVARSKKPGKLSYLRISMNEQGAGRLLDYLEEYRKQGYHRWYGMKNRPLHGEGGGCSAFAASFLEVCGLLREEFAREWTRTFNIPHSLIGGPITGRKVSILDIFRKADRWAHDHEPHEKGFFWDPDLMHAWLTRQHVAVSSDGHEEFTAETWNEAKGVHFDGQAVLPPNGEIFKHRA